MITHEDSLKDFSLQLQYVLDNYSSHGLKVEDFNHIVYGGLGGSGIGGLITKSWFFDKSPVPMEVVNDYHLPAYVGEKTLVILNSYSGNTEETLSLYAEAKKHSCTIIAMSSGGQLKELSTADGVQYYPLEPGFQPRQTLGLGLTYLLLVTGELLGANYRPDIEAIKNELVMNQERQIVSAQRITDFYKSSLNNKFVILADRQMYPLAVRFQEQLNENAKMEAFVHPIPEANHNVLESYIDRLPSNFLLLYTEENVRVGSRFDFLSGHLEMDNNRVLPLAIPKYDLYTIYDVNYRLDWVSVNIANTLDSDLMNVPNIDALKEYLQNVEEVFSDEDE